LWVQQDANWDVTALVNGLGAVVERYVYDPYGVVTVLSAAWGTLSGSIYAWIYGHQGGRFDPTTGLYSFRYRDLSPVLGRWLQVDPLGFAAGQMNLSQYVGNGPTSASDPIGLCSLITPQGQQALAIAFGVTVIGVGAGASLTLAQQQANCAAAGIFTIPAQPWRNTNFGSLPTLDEISGLGQAVLGAGLLILYTSVNGGNGNGNNGNGNAGGAGSGSSPWPSTDPPVPPPAQSQPSSGAPGINLPPAPPAELGGDGLYWPTVPYPGWTPPPPPPPPWWKKMWDWFFR
jgi:RHS repeat-associated protein